MLPSLPPHSPHHYHHHPSRHPTSSHKKGSGNKIDPSRNTSAVFTMDFTLRLSDELLLRIFRILPSSPYPYSQVCKRWSRLQGLLRTSIKVLDWKFLESGRMSVRFPNVTDVDLTFASISSKSDNHNFSNVFLSHGRLCIRLNAEAFDPPSITRFIQDQQILPSKLAKGLKVLADDFPHLRRLCVVHVTKPEGSADSLLFHDPAAYFGKEGHGGLPQTGKEDELQSTEFVKDDEKAKLHSDRYDHGLLYLARKCQTLQELELHQCSDESLNAISAFENLQIVRLICFVSNYRQRAITDVGLTILARNCSRLVKLDLSGCEGSYDGIAAIGRCCLMLEELNVSNHMFSDGWLAGLPFCRCLKTLRLENCKQIDSDPGPFQHLGYCMALDRLQLVRCNLRDVVGFQALMMLSLKIQHLEIEDCWGLDNEIFSFAAACRNVKLLSVEGCSLLTTKGIETIVLSYKELRALRVRYCDSIRDADISSALAFQFCNLRELKWCPNAKHLLSSSLAGTGIGQQGRKFFKKGGPN